MKQKSSNILKSLWETLLEQLKGQAVKLALKKILGSAAAGGFKAWLVAFVVKNFWDELVEPLMNAALIEVKYIKNKIEGKITAKKISEARESGSDQDYDDAVDASLN
tara:strand:+ start:323 stop:643 length:321 start_codon:yes stop_codon:yes gene_type:complete